MRKIIRYAVILLAFIIVLIIASCMTTNQMSLPKAPPDMRQLRFCKDNEPEVGCRKMGPAATGADRGIQEDPREVP